MLTCTLETVAPLPVKSCTFILLGLGLSVCGLACSETGSWPNSQVGSVRSIAAITGAKFNVDVFLKYAGDASVTRKGNVALELSFDEVGQMLGSKCPIV